MARVKPRATARPSPTPAPRRGLVSSRRWNGWKTCSRSSTGMPLPRSTTRSRTRPAAMPASTRTGQSLWPWAMALSTRLATTRSSSAGSAWTGGTSSARRRPRHGRAGQAGERGGDDLLEGRRPEQGRDGAGVDAGHVEEVVDEVGEPVGLVLDRLEELGGLLRGPGDVGLAEAVDRRLDPGERGAQVVGDRLEQSAAQLVRFGEGGCLGGLGVESRRSRAAERLAAKALSTRRSSPARSPPDRASTRSSPTAWTSSAARGVVRWRRRRLRPSSRGRFVAAG